MSHRRTAGRLPLEQPLLEKENVEDTWAKWFTTVSDNVYRYDKYEVSFNPTSVSANTTSEQTITIVGVASNDFVTISKPSHTAGLGIVNIRVSAKDTIAITYMNNTGSPIDPPSETYIIKVEKI